MSPSEVAELLDRIPGAREAIEQAVEQARRGQGIPLDALALKDGLIDLIQSSRDELEALRTELVERRSVFDKAIAFIDGLLAECGAAEQPSRSR